MGKKNDRQKKILKLIETQGILSVKKFSELLNVSEMTIRRDLEEIQNLENDIISSGSKSYNLLEAASHQNENKKKIGAFAASLVKPNETIIIDTGSTSSKVINYLAYDNKNTIISYNANVLMGLRHESRIQLLFCGGIYHQETEMFESKEGLDFLRKYRANKLFLSAAGIHETLGITCHHTYEVATKQTAIEASLERILLVDSSKFGAVSPAHVSTLSAIHTVITDAGINDYWRDVLASLNITLHIV